MLVSQKCQYALRAIFELARQKGGAPLKMAKIAQAQAIPQRFLEVILSGLKQGGFVQSRRGREGGYILVRSAEGLKIGEIIRFIEGPLGPVGCVADSSKKSCRLYGDCVFLPMWEKVRDAIAGVYDNTTFQDLVDQQRLNARKEVVPCYSI